MFSQPHVSALARMTFGAARFSAGRTVLCISGYPAASLAPLPDATALPQLALPRVRTHPEVHGTRPWPRLCLWRQGTCAGMESTSCVGTPGSTLLSRHGCLLSARSPALTRAVLMCKNPFVGRAFPETELPLAFGIPAFCS